MERTKSIFNYVFSLPAYSKLSNWTIINFVINMIVSYFYQPKYELEYVTVESGLSSKSLHDLRHGRELQSLETFNNKTKSNFQSMFELQNWLFRSHNAYSSSRHVIKNENDISEELLKSY